MKAPDKIYLSVGKGEDWAYAMWTQKTPEEQKFSELDEHEEYIRKDALLEWAKEMKEQVGLGLNAYDMGEENGKADILNALIDKLNEM